MIITDNTVYFLYRRGSKQHIKALYEKGEIYINTIDYIRKCDSNQERSDLDDGLKARKYYGNVTITMCDVGLDIDKYGVDFQGEDCVMKIDHVKKGNIYCLSGIYTEHITGTRENLEFNTKSFGDSLILIHNPKEFINRIVTELEKKGFNNVKYGPVEYYKSDYSGPVGFFKKNERFKSQNEFRFFIPNDDMQPIKIHIGSIKDIARIENNSLIKVTFTDKKEQLIKL